MSRLRPTIPWFRLAPSITAVPNFGDAETPTGAINGTNVTFTLATAPSPATSLILVLNGATQTPGTGNDFTISGTTITYATAPPTGSQHRAWYRS